MNKIFKVLASVLFVLLLLLVGSGAYLSRNLPAVIKGLVEQELPQITGTEVTLGGVQIIYGTGRVVINDLVIKNPVGFKGPYAFWLHKMAFQIHIPSVFQDVVVIDEFSIEKTTIIAEQAGTSLRTNLQVITDHAIKGAGPSKQEAATDTAVRKLILKEFRFTGNSIDLVSPQWGDQTIAIPDLIFNDIGLKEGGLTQNQLSQRMIKLVTQQANQAVKEELKQLAKSSITGKIKDKLSRFLGRDE